MKSRRIAGPLFLLLIIASFGLWLHGAVPDVPTGQWLPGPALAQPREGAVSVALDDGRVLVIGGRTASGPVSTVEVFNANGSLAVGAHLLSRRAGHTATKLPDGSVLVVGGRTLVTTDDGSGPVTVETVTNSAEVFDVNAGLWYPAASLSIARSGHTATAVADGHVVIAGGAGTDGAALDSFEVFDPVWGVFSSAGLLSAARTEHAAAAAGATKVLVAGGHNANGALGTADVVDVASGSVTGVVLNSPRAGASATALLDGTILIAGGSDGVNDLASAEIVDPVSGFSALSGSMTQGRRGHHAVLLDHNATVLILGGTRAGIVVSGAEQFVPWTGQFSATGSPATPRSSAVLSNLAKDGVAWLVAGRSNDGGRIGGSELYGFATVKTDRNDYAPGMTVTMSGSGWQPGERVTLLLHEVSTGHADRTYLADADPSGRIINSEFVVDTQHIGVRFFLTARGAGSQAQTTFTDGNLQSDVTFSLGPGTVSSGATLSWTATATCQGGGNGNNTCAANGFVVDGPVADGYLIVVERSPNSNFNPANSITSVVTTSTTGGAVGGTFTAPAAAGTYYYRAHHADQQIAPNSWQKADSNTVQITVTSCTAPEVTTQPISQSITYGQNASFQTAASGTPTPTVQWQVSTNGGGSWTNLGGQTATMLTLTKPTVAMSGNQYRAVFTNTCTPATATSNAATLTVSPKNLTISSAVAQNKVYDTTAAATVSFSSAVLAGVESGDTVTISSTGYAATFTNKAVGDSKPVTVTGVTLSGASAGNYTVSQPSGLTANITPKSVTGSFTAASKVYDGTTAATVATSSLSGVIAPDVVTLSVTSAQFVTKTAGIGKIVAANLALAGADAGNYTVNPTATAAADITPKNLTINGAVTSDKPYDGTATATVTFGSASLVGVVSGDNVAINSADYAASFADKAVGSNKPVTVTGVVLSGGDAGNYTVSQPSGLMANITAKALTITAAVANSKQYDGTVTATVNFAGASLVGVASGDSVSIDHADYSASFADETVGTGKPVTVTGVALSAGDAGNYIVSQPSGLAADITPKSLTGSFTAENKFYDGTTTATVATSSLPGVIASDVVTLNVTNAAFDTKAVGSGKTVTADLALSGANAANYTVNATASTQADVTPKALTGSFTAQNRVYDGTTTATVLIRSLSDLIAGDVVSLTGGTASFGDKNVGTGKTVTLSGASLTGADSANYSLSSVGTTTADISDLGITGSFAAESKTYDGTIVATVASRSLSGTIIGDMVDMTGGTAAFDNKNVGTGKTVTLTGATLAGADAGNYSLSSVTTTTADITPRPLVVSATGVNKVYDGTTVASVTLSDDRVSGDVVTGSYTSATFADKSVGNSKSVSVSGITISGADAGNYTTNPTAATTADITPRALTVSATGVDKTYDGTTTATVTLSDDRVSGDTLSLAYASAAFADKHVGTGKTVSVSGISISGVDAGNYTFNASASTTADIAALGLTGHFTAANKVYDGTTAATIDGRSVSGVVDGDDVRLSGGAATFGDKNVADGKTVTLIGATLAGAHAGNYSLESVNTTTANITPKSIVGSFTASHKVYDGTTSATVTGRIVVPIHDDTLSLVHGTATFADKNVGTGKTVTLVGAGLAGSDAANYSLTSVNTTTANITVASLTITASSPADMLVHGPVPTITAAYTGFVTGDNAANSLDTQPTCSTNYTVTSAVGTYTTSCTGAVATNYTIATVAGSFKVLFLWDGFLQPINDTAHDVHTTAPFSKFKLGQTIPAKFDLKDANGNAVTQTGNPTFNYRKIGNNCNAFTEAETLDELAYMPSSVPLFTLSGGHYQYNWSTKGLQVGLYSIYANLADGTSRTVNVCFAK